MGRFFGRLSEQMSGSTLTEAVVYDALTMFGGAAEPVFAGGLRSGLEHVRVASCFGVAELSEPDTARRLLEPLLDDREAAVRAAAADSLAQLGGASIPAGLARASRDEQPSVRGAAVRALGFYDDPRGVELATNALLDPDRETAVRAGEALVRLSRLPATAAAATRRLQAGDAPWPIERAQTFASLGALK